MKVKENRPVERLLAGALAVLIGKGGVGKTSLSAALALSAARRGRRVLLAEVRSPRRIPPLFGIDPRGDGPLALEERLTWLNLTPEAALEIYAMKLLRFRAVYRAVFEQRTVRRFLRAVPALAEILVLGHLAFLVESGEYDQVILDAPAAGPGTLTLAAPGAVLQDAPRGPLADGAAWILRLLSDPAQTSVHLVVTPEELPVCEAVELFHRLRDDLALPLGAVLVNRTLPDPFPPGGEAPCEFPNGSAAGRALAGACTLLRARLGLQQKYRDRLRAGVDLPAILLPEVLGCSDDRALIEELALVLGPGSGSPR